MLIHPAPSAAALLCRRSFLILGQFIVNFVINFQLILIGIDIDFDIDADTPATLSRCCSTMLPAGL